MSLFFSLSDRLVPYGFQTCPGVGYESKEGIQALTCIIHACRAIIDPFGLTTSFNLTVLAMAEKPGAAGSTSIAIDILGSQLHSELFGPLAGDFFAFAVIVVLSSQICRAFRTIESTAGNFFIHFLLLPS